MKSKTFFVAFLLLLYIAPMIFISSHASSGVFTGPNMNKDFSISADWYNESWDYRQLIIIDGGAVATEANYQLLVDVTYNAHMQVDFSDIRFLETDHETLLDYWLETKTNSVSASFWVEVKDGIDKGTVYDGSLSYIYMYYGNDTVNTSSNGTATFLFFDDFNDDVLDTTNWQEWGGSDGVPSETDGSQQLVGQAAKWAFWGTYEQWNDDVALGMNIKADAEAHYWLIGLDERTFNGSAQDGIDQACITFDTATKYYSATANTANTKNARATLYSSYVTCEIQWTNDIEFYEDHVLVSTIAKDPVNDMGIALMSLNARTTYMNWTYVRNCVDDAPYIDSWGEEEEYGVPPEWFNVGEAELIFIVPVDETGLDMLLIFLGLFMIPASTIYMVKGGKEEATMEKLFFGLIAFVIGWALFLGGIM